MKCECEIWKIWCEFVCVFVDKFVKKSVIGESVDFSYDFCIYIGRKWFGLWGGIWCVRLVKVLIFLWFDDIGYDIEIW